jgi:hypothetical protein
MKTELGTLGTAQKMKAGSDALGSAENESGSAKHEFGTQHSRYHQKWVPERKSWKIELDCATLFRALLTAVGDGMRKKDTEIPPERVFV